MAGRTLGKPGKKLVDPEAAKAPVPARTWDQIGEGASAIRRVPKYMAKTLERKQRENFGDMLDGGDRAAAMDSKTAAAVAAKAGPIKTDGDDFL